MNALNLAGRSSIALTLLALAVPFVLALPSARAADLSRLTTKTVAQQRAAGDSAPKRRADDADARNPADDSEDFPQIDPLGPEPRIKLNYVGASWSKVLQDLAEATQTELVADRVPTTKYSRWDWARHTRDEALKILNAELESQNFRLQIKGRYLVLNHLKELRHEYPPSVMRGSARARDDAGQTGAERAPAAASRDQQKTARAKRPDKGRIQQVSGSEIADESPAARSRAETIQTVVKLKSRGAVAVSKAIYGPLKPHAELLDDGPGGFQGFAVRSAAPQKTSKKKSGSSRPAGGPPPFAIGIDQNRNELVVEATPETTQAVLKLIKTVDAAPKAPQGVVRTVATAKDADQVAAAVERPIRRLASETRKVAQRDADQDTDQPAQRRLPGRRGAGGATGEAATDGATTGEELVGSVKGEVTVESVPEMGILVVKGNQSDVEAVMAVIREIERLSAGTAPAVEVAILNHVSSEGLAALLTNVYEKLGAARTSTVQQTQAITVFPVSRPNAVLIVASQADMAHVIKLINDLDQETDPKTEFRVIRLKHAVPGKVVDQIEALYPAQQQQGTGAQQTTVGLAPRVRVIEDLRTNSVIVLARPRDMNEIAELIEDLDVAGSDSEQLIRIFKLENAVADEVAYTLSQAIQSVLAPARATAAPATGQQGGFGAGAQPGQAQAGATSGGASEIREVKSSILKYLSDDGQREVRSGILADIRMTADPRTNSIVVTAPKESMELVAELIDRLDRLPSSVAAIKIFPVKNGDATSMVTLLERLFGIQRAGQGGQQGAQGAGAAPGLLVTDAEDTSSMLIPLRFAVDVRTNSITAIGGAAALDVVQAVVLTLDQSDIQQRQNDVYRLKNAPAQSVATAISQFLQTQQQAFQQDPGLLSPFEQIEREVIVVPETTSNSLLISATPRYFKQIMELITKLDRSPKQVLIQGLIVEVSLNNTDEFGMEFGLQDSILFKRSPLTANPIFQSLTTTAPSNGVQTTTQNILSESAVPGFNFSGQPLGNNTSPGVNQSNVGTQGFTGFSTGLTNPTLGYGGLVLQAGSENVNFLLRALSVRTRLDVLSRPQIRTVDNQIAQIQVGQEIPRISGFTPSGTAGVITPTVQQRAIGIILQVTPRITPDNLVIMEVAARRDSLDPKSVSLGFSAAGTTISSPIIDTTNALTTIAIRSGQTVILGGMITKQDSVEERKVPVIGDIPIIGRAFRYDLKTMQRTELLIFLTPRVIGTDEEGDQMAEMYKQIEIERLNFIESEAMQLHGPLYGLPPEPMAAPPAPVPETAPPPKAKPIPPPPDAAIPGATDPNLPPEPDAGAPGARALRYDDEEDLEVPFESTGRKGARGQAGRVRLVSADEPPPAAEGTSKPAKKHTKKKLKSGDDSKPPAKRRPMGDF